MSAIKFGCQTYTWQMSYEKYKFELAHIIAIAGDADFAGVESEVCMLGPLADAAQMKSVLDKSGIQLAAICLVEDWAHPEETPEEKQNAGTTMDLLSEFPGAVLALCQMPGKDRTNLRTRQMNAIACANAVASRAKNRGIETAFHPNSPPGSVFRTGEDYDLLMEHIDRSVLGFAPDVGHMAKGGMDPLETMKKHRSIIRHIHYKDMKNNGAWAQMGEGDIDFAAITTYMRETGYDGWIMIEDECKKAESDPDTVTRENGVYLKRVLN